MGFILLFPVSKFMDHRNSDNNLESHCVYVCVCVCVCVCSVGSIDISLWVLQNFINIRIHMQFKSNLVRIWSIHGEWVRWNHLWLSSVSMLNVSEISAACIVRVGVVNDRMSVMPLPIGVLCGMGAESNCARWPSKNDLLPCSLTRCPCC
jgi:hypothetical protein